MNGKTTSHAPAAASSSKRSRDDTDLLATRCTLVAVMRGFIVFLFVLPVIFISWGWCGFNHVPVMKKTLLSIQRSPQPEMLLAILARCNPCKTCIWPRETWNL